MIGPVRSLGTLALLGALFVLPRDARAAEFPTLERAIDLARTRAIVVAEAQAELGVANAQMAGARVSSLGNPYTEIQIDRGWTQPNPGDRTGIVQAMTFTYIPVDIAGQRGKRIEEADRLIHWRRLGVTGANAEATGEAVAAYGEMVVGAQRILESAAGEATAREEAKYFEGRFESKDTTLYEKSLAEAEVARWLQSKAEAMVRLTRATARFGQVIGLPVVGAPPPNTPILPPNLRASWDDARIGKLVDRTPIVTRLVAERAYWDASIERYEREKIPPVSFEVIAGRGGGFGELRLGGGAVITFPITRRFQGEIARAERGRENANRQLELYRTIIETRVRAARDALVVVRAALDELDATGMPALERAVAASVEGFKAGKVDLTRALLARRDFALARARRLDLIETAWRAYADLVILTGELP
jgi:cobalt-zinc-cadmium efflux system outer membrane protein